MFQFFIKVVPVFSENLFWSWSSETFTISSDCYIKTCRSLNGGLFQESLLPCFRGTYCLSVGFKRKLYEEAFSRTIKLVQTTTSIRRPRLSPPKQIPIKSLLYKKTTCLTPPATTLFLTQIKKNCLKQLLQNFTVRRNGKET